jgi:3'(2'), 5'-bisphosphate nucleotidase
LGSFKKTGDEPFETLKVNNKTENWVAVGSKSHAQPGETKFYERIGVVDVFSVGSSLKFCLIAEGKADVYFRSGPTMEWDTAAGHAIVKAAGGEMYKDLNCEEIFTYNKENLRNGAFLCSSNRKFAE